jgi:flagellar biosynthetic protein FliP
MAPVASRVNTEAYEPYVQKQMTELQAYEATRVVVSDFLLAQTRQDDLQLFYDLSKAELPNEPDDVSLHLLIPSFMISELRTGFEMGFLLFLPFVMVDLIVGSLLTAMGMVMLPPTMISTPLKILLFVLVDGWALITKSIVGSFSL